MVVDMDDIVLIIISNDGFLEISVIFKFEPKGKLRVE